MNLIIKGKRERREIIEKIIRPGVKLDLELNEQIPEILKEPGFKN